MDDLCFEEILEMQRNLQAAHAHEWTPLSPAHGRDSLLWMIGEAGEVSSLIKKRGDGDIMENEAVRDAFIEEMSDVLMYYGDVMLCYGISAKELGDAYRRKHKRNLTRDYQSESDTLINRHSHP